MKSSALFFASALIATSAAQAMQSKSVDNKLMAFLPTSSEVRKLHAIMTDTNPKKQHVNKIVEILRSAAYNGAIKRKLVLDALERLEMREQCDKVLEILFPMEPVIQMDEAQSIENACSAIMMKTFMNAAKKDAQKLKQDAQKAKQKNK